MRCLELWPRREEKEGAIVLYLTNGLLQDVQLHYQANRLLLCCFINNVASTPTTNNLKFHTFVLHHLHLPMSMYSKSTHSAGLHPSVIMSVL